MPVPVPVPDDDVTALWCARHNLNSDSKEYSGYSSRGEIIPPRP